MTVDELRNALIGLDGNLLVVLQRDPEGNGYAPAAGIDIENQGFAENEVCPRELTVDLKEQGYNENDIASEATPCVVFWPEW